jgi:hypothetical protein
LEKGYFVPQRIVSVVERVEFVCSKLSYVDLTDRWCNVIVMDVHAPIEKKMMTKKIVSMRNCVEFSIMFLNTI